MTGFTPEEWRTAARVARRSIFTEGNPDLADAWDKAADQVEARLIPAGGMALAAEQVEDVRLTVWSEGDIADAAYNRLRALFLATEPVEECCTFYAQTEHGDIQCNLPDGHAAHHRIDPVPAVPAEEETKAEADGERDALAMWLTGYGLPDLMAEGIATALLNDYQLKGSASSPVVPAPTETEWRSLNDVPPTVRKVKDVKGHEWLRRDCSLEWLGCGGPWNSCRVGHLSLAPFVAAEEG